MNQETVDSYRQFITDLRLTPNADGVMNKMLSSLVAETADLRSELARAEARVEELKDGIKDFISSHKDEARVPLGDLLQFATEWGIEVFQEYIVEITSKTIFTIQAEIGQEPREDDFYHEVTYTGNYEVGSMESGIDRFEVYPRN